MVQKDSNASGASESENSIEPKGALAGLEAIASDIQK